MLCAAYVLAPWLAAFYGEARVTLLVRVSACGFLVIALRTIPMALLRKRLQFGRYAALDTAWHISSGALTAVMALMGAGYWSMVIPPVAAGLGLAPLWFVAARWRPSFTFEFAVFREVFLYSKNVVSASLLLLVLNNAGFIIAGHLLSTGEAGEYKVAMENAMFVVFNFAWLVGNVTLSGFALRQGQDERLRAAFTRVYEVLTATTLPFHVLLFVLADVLFSGVIDPKWAPAMPLFRILLVYATVRAVIAHVAPFYNAINRTDVILKYYACVTVLCVPAMYLGCLYHGLTGLAWASSVLQALGAVTILGLTPRILSWSSLGYVRRTVPFVMASVAVALAAKGAAAALSNFGLPAAIVFFAASAVGGLCYPSVLYLVDRPRFQQILTDLMPDRIRTKYFGFLMRTKENAT
jgi:O-antigen/teichoic acid export membrane protein